MIEKLVVGDRVMLQEWDRNGIQGYRFGEVIEVYRGLPSGTGEAVEMLAVKWNDGQVERGFIQGARLRKYITVPTMWLPNVVPPQA